MWTGLKENSTYTAQITPYHGKVNAEILVLDKDKGFYEPKLGLYLTVMEKSFGRSFSTEPREQDWVDAKKWVETQLKMIEEHGTVIVTKPNFLKEYR